MPQNNVSTDEVLNDITDWLHRLLELESQATPSPWWTANYFGGEAPPSCSVGAYDPDNASQVRYVSSSIEKNFNADSSFIADSRNAMRFLVSAIQETLRNHYRRSWQFGDFVHFGQTEFPDICGKCLTLFPCPDVKSIIVAYESEINNNL